MFPFCVGWAARRAGIGPAFSPVSIAKAESVRCMVLVLASELVLAMGRLVLLDEVQGKLRLGEGED